MKLKIITFIFGFVLIRLFAEPTQIFSQETQVKLVDFRKVVEQRLLRFVKKTIINGKSIQSNSKLEDICRVDTDSVENRVFREYGAIFVADDKVSFPPKCIFQSEDDVKFYQVKANPQTRNISGVQITLQQPAMEALLKAIQEAAKKNLRISPRGGSLAAERSFEDTVRLWNSRFYPGLNYWVGRRKISRREAVNAVALPIQEQVARVLDWESKGLFFSKNLKKSILFSVAAPGASQHNFLLALDVEQFANKAVRKILADNGWFQTVLSDLPHFTYLGVKDTELPTLGLKEVPHGNQIFWIPNIVEPTTKLEVKK